MSDRRMVEGLASPFPLGIMMPAIYQGDDLTQRFTAALDEVLAPVLGVLDSLDAYLDPKLAPPDFAAWLASWVAVVLDDHWSLERQREVVQAAADLYSWRGTRYGIAEVIRLYTGMVAEVVDTGAVVASDTPGTDLPGMEEPGVAVVLPGEADLARVDQLVALLKPAHVAHRVSVAEP